MNRLLVPATLLLVGATAICCIPSIGIAATRAASISTCNPVLSSVTSLHSSGHPHHYAPGGDEVTITGTGLTEGGCTTVSVAVGHVSVPRRALTIAPGGSRITFALPDGASGAVSVIDTNADGITSRSNANLIFLQSPHASMQAAMPVAGSAIEVDGTDFGPFREPQFGGVRETLVVAQYPSCPGSYLRIPVTVLSDATIALRAPAEYCESSLTLLFISPSDTSKPRDCSSAPTSAQYNCIAVLVTAGIVDPYFYIASASPAPMTRVEPGAVITLRGSGFGRSGRADIGGIPIPSHWTDTAIAVTVPRNATSGKLRLWRTTGDLHGVGVGTYQVDNTARTNARSVGIQSIQLAIASAGLLVDVGSEVSVTATLSVNGQPVSGAPMAVSVVPDVGMRGKVGTASGTTDTTGSFSVVFPNLGDAATDILTVKDGIRVVRERLVVQRSRGAPGAILGGTPPFGLGPIMVTLADDPVGVVISLISASLLILAVLITVGISGRAFIAIAVGRKVRSDGSARG